MKPPSANAVSLARVGDTVSADARRLVLADADDRAPDAGAAQVPDERASTITRHREHEVVVVAVQVRAGRPGRACRAGSSTVSAPSLAGEDRPAEDVALRRDREGHRADREQQALHAQRADPDEHGERGTRRARRGRCRARTGAAAASGRSIAADEQRLQRRSSDHDAADREREPAALAIAARHAVTASSDRRRRRARSPSRTGTAGPRR